MNELPTPADVLESGGVILVGILALSSVAWVLITWKWLALRRARYRADPRVDAAISLATSGRWVEARRLASAPDASLALRTVGLTLRALRDDPDGSAFERHVAPELATESSSLRRHLDLLGVSATALPLLGLLGTVLGMLRTFAALGDATSSTTESVASGVSLALVTTQAGLLAAVPVVVLHVGLSARADRVHRRLEEAARRAAAAVR